MSEHRYQVRLDSFGVVIAGCFIVVGSFAQALKMKYGVMQGQGEIRASMKRMWNHMDVDGAFLYDGSTWATDGDVHRPVLVRGIEY